MFIAYFFNKVHMAISNTSSVVINKPKEKKYIPTTTSLMFRVPQSIP